MNFRWIIDQLRTAHRGTDQFLDYRTIINDFEEQLVIVTKPTSTNAITLECVNFVPAHIPDDVKMMEKGAGLLNRTKKRKSEGVEGVFRSEQGTNRPATNALKTVAAKSPVGPPSTIPNKISSQTVSSGSCGSSAAMGLQSDIQTKSSAVSCTIYTSAAESDASISVQNRSTFNIPFNVGPKSYFLSTPVVVGPSATSAVRQSDDTSTTTMRGEGRETAVTGKGVHDGSIDSHRDSEGRDSYPDMGDSIAVEDADHFGHHVVDDVIMENY